MHEIEADLMKQIVGVPVEFDEPKNVGTLGYLVLEIEGKIGEEDEDDVPHCAFGFIYVIGLLSLLDARPAGSGRRPHRRRTRDEVLELLKN